MTSVGLFLGGGGIAGGDSVSISKMLAFKFFM